MNEMINLLAGQPGDMSSDLHYVPAPCQKACPVGTDVASYLALIWEGKDAEAFEAITATNPFSAICGRVCDAPCEPACRRADADGPVAIRNLKRYVMDKFGQGYRLPPLPVTRDETVAVVGAGPAGMTAAQDLAEAGYAVHVYEMTDKAGGMATWGIPAFRLPRGIIDDDIERILQRCPGIAMHYNTALGREVTLAELKGRHHAVLLTIGATWGRTLGVPGDDRPEVLDGVGFLRRINSGERPHIPAEVLVIGGGDVAMDACRAARRLPGCERVRVLYRRGPDEMPARKDELHGATAEGIEIVYNTLPVAVVEQGGGGIALRCVKTALGAADADGRRRPTVVPGSEHDVPCGMVIAAIGQTARCDDLDRGGLLRDGRVSADFATMRTSDPQVFAAGDGAFGGSSIVEAMHHGHRAAYYIKAHLAGIDTPLPYRTPQRTRRVPLAQDPLWEKFNRTEQVFHGLGGDPVAFAEVEDRYTDEQARQQAARCYRCDYETGSADYSVRNRETIFDMARLGPGRPDRLARITQERLRPRENPFPPEHPAAFDDLVFLPANLTRLVIDPYREACDTRLRLGRLDLPHPFLAAGYDDAPEQVRQGLAAGLRVTGGAYVGLHRLAPDLPWLQVVAPGQVPPSAEADALFYHVGAHFRPVAAERLRPDQSLGLVVSATALAEAIPFALEQGFDLLLLDGSGAFGAAWAELEGPPNIAILRDAVRALRDRNQEEAIDLLYFGGIRSGTDMAKAIGLGAKAVAARVALAIAMGGGILGQGLAWSADQASEECGEAAALFIKAAVAEGSMMARCTGKTKLLNIEPEDLRSISLATAAATDIGLVASSTVVHR